MGGTLEGTLHLRRSTHVPPKVQRNCHRGCAAVPIAVRLLPCAAMRHRCTPGRRPENDDFDHTLEPQICALDLASGHQERSGPTAILAVLCHGVRKPRTISAKVTIRRRPSPLNRLPVRRPYLALELLGQRGEYDDVCGAVQRSQWLVERTLHGTRTVPESPGSWAASESPPGRAANEALHGAADGTRRPLIVGK